MNRLPDFFVAACKAWGPCLVVLVGAWLLVANYGRVGGDEPVPLWIVPVDIADDGVTYILLDKEGLDNYCRE